MAQPEDNVRHEPRDDSADRLAEEVGNLVAAWTKASTEAWLGTTRVLSNLAANFAGNDYNKTVNRAMRDTADVLRRSSEHLAQAAPPPEEKPPVTVKDP